MAAQVKIELRRMTNCAINNCPWKHHIKTYRAQILNFISQQNHLKWQVHHWLWQNPTDLQRHSHFYPHYADHCDCLQRGEYGGVSAPPQMWLEAGNLALVKHMLCGWHPAHVGGPDRTALHLLHLCKKHRFPWRTSTGHYEIIFKTHEYKKLQNCRR